MVLEPFFAPTFLPVHPYFYPSTTVFTRPNDSWTGLCIKLWCSVWCGSLWHIEVWLHIFHHLCCPSPCCVMLLGGDAAVDVDACWFEVCSPEVSLQMTLARPSSRTYTPALYWHVVIVSPHRVFMCVPAQTLTETNVTSIKATTAQLSMLMLTS